MKHIKLCSMITIIAFALSAATAYADTSSSSDDSTGKIVGGTLGGATGLTAVGLTARAIVKKIKGGSGTLSVEDAQQQVAEAGDALDDAQSAFETTQNAIIQAKDFQDAVDGSSSGLDGATQQVKTLYKQATDTIEKGSEAEAQAVQDAQDGLTAAKASLKTAQDATESVPAATNVSGEWAPALGDAGAGGATNAGNQIAQEVGGAASTTTDASGEVAKGAAESGSVIADMTEVMDGE